MTALRGQSLLVLRDYGRRPNCWSSGLGSGASSSAATRPVDDLWRRRRRRTHRGFPSVLHVGPRSTSEFNSMFLADGEPRRSSADGCPSRQRHLPMCWMPKDCLAVDRTYASTSMAAAPESLVWQIAGCSIPAHTRYSCDAAIDGFRWSTSSYPIVQPGNLSAIIPERVWMDGTLIRPRFRIPTTLTGIRPSRRVRCPASVPESNPRRSRVQGQAGARAAPTLGRWGP